jgi:hypothetical protein
VRHLVRHLVHHNSGKFQIKTRVQLPWATRNGARLPKCRVVKVLRV